MIFESTIATLDLNANRGLKVYTPLVRTEENLKSVIILEKSNTLIHFLKLLMIWDSAFSSNQYIVKH